MQHRLLPGCQRIQPHEMLPGRPREFNRIHRSRDRPQRDELVRPFETQLPSSHASQRTAAQDNPTLIDRVVATNGGKGLIDVGFSFKAVGVLPHAPQGMYFDVIHRCSRHRLCMGRLDITLVEVLHELQFAESRRVAAAMQNDIQSNRRRRVVAGGNDETIWLHRVVDGRDEASDRSSLPFRPENFARGK